MAPYHEETAYRMPPGSIARMAGAVATPEVVVAPNGNTLLLLHKPSLPSLEDLIEPELKLAGLRFTEKRGPNYRRPYYAGISVLGIASSIPDGQTSEPLPVPVKGLPLDAKLRDFRFSASTTIVAFTHYDRETGVQLWSLDYAQSSLFARQVGSINLNAVFYDVFSWLNETEIVCLVAPEERGKNAISLRQKEQIIFSPVVQESAGGVKKPARTYQDLLKSPRDEKLFEHYASSEVVIIDVESGKIRRRIGDKQIYRSVSPSPDGALVKTEILQRPFSFNVPYYRFPVRVEICNLEGEVVRVVADNPLAEDMPISFDARRKGPRSFSWRADAARTLVWAEAQDGGDPAVETEVRDSIFLLDFSGADGKTVGDKSPLKLLDLSCGYDDIQWSEAGFALVSGWWWKTRTTRSWIVSTPMPLAESTTAESNPRKFIDRSFEDRYADPGTPLTKRGKYGKKVLVSIAMSKGGDEAGSGFAIFMSGKGANPQGDMPFLDLLDLTTLKPKRLWRCKSDEYEDYAALASMKYDSMSTETVQMNIVTSCETQSAPPDYYLRSIEVASQSSSYSVGDRKRLTSFEHPYPEIKDVKKELVKYSRKDGVELSATLYLPATWKEGEDPPLPTILWAYPREFKSKAAAAQVQQSNHRFVQLNPMSPLFFLAHGYAILFGPSMPIIAEGDEEPNDTYISQLVAGAEAAVDYIVSRGVAERGKIAVGGHSYGAFMTANLLAHSNFFCCGIARSGAYNRTLTPFGFQAEERTFWEAPNVYISMSPFANAHKVKTPILLIHGAEDENSGTFPEQSERFYAALKGQGAIAKLVLLPKEGHHYKSRENILHQLYEMISWLDLYCKRQSTKTDQAETSAALSHL